MSEKIKEKKRLIIFIAVAYGITFLMGILMWYGHANHMDVSVFPNAQMFYPAAGMILASLIMEKKKCLPKLFYRFFLVMTGAFIILAAASVLVPDPMFFAKVPELAAYTGMEWLMLTQLLMMGGSILAWIFMAAAGKEKRKAAGLQWKNGTLSVFCILVFVLLYFLRTAVACALSGQLDMFLMIFEMPMTWMSLAVMPINFLLVFTAFFGEEYGWRYYLQPYLQKRFGLRGGVIVLGIVWGLWHLPVDFFYYSPDAGLIAAVSQQITCITLGIFFAWAYMKTQNIWVPVILHFLNNNLIPVISGTYSADVLQNQTIAWADLLPALLLNGVIFGGFLLTKEFHPAERGASVSED